MKKISSVLKNRYTNFEELELAIEKIEDTIEKGDAMEYFSYFYLKQHSDFFNIREIYMEDEIPLDIRNKLKLENKDNGVDGVIIRNDNKIVAYQVKFRSNRCIPTAQELSTFWAESEYADMRLIIANCGKLPKVASKKKNQMSLLIDSFLPLDRTFFDNLYNYFNGITLAKTLKYSPRPYQEKMLKEIIDGFSSSNRGKMIAACGVGKTLTALWLQERMQANTILYIVPSLALIKQTLESWVQNKNEDFDFLCVCSDSSVVNSLDEDDLSLNASDVYFPVTTNHEDIKNFLNRETKLKRILFVTYHSLDAIVNGIADLDTFSFDLAIFDESHRTAGTKDSKMFIYGLKDEYIPVKKRLFMTATERLVSPRIKSSIEDSENIVFSMDDVSLYGPTFTSLNFGEAIEQNIICDYRIVLCTINEEDIAALYESKKYVSTEIGESSATTNTQTLLKQVLVGKALKDLGVKKIITYHRYVKDANSFIKGNSNTMPLESVIESVMPTIQNKDLYTAHINGSMSAGLRKELLSNFASSDFGVISNAKCLTEGVDVPAVDGVYFVDPKNSMIDIVQAVGRALRKSPSKADDCSYIIVPLVIPKGASIFSHIKPSNFDTLHNVIQALRSQDKALADIIDEINFSAATGTTGSGTGKMNSKVITLSFSKLGINDFQNSLELRIAEINKNPIQTGINTTDWSEAKARKSDVKRVFVSIGDYTLEAYKDSLVMPTLKLFSSLDEKLEGNKLKINHNNVSHSVRMGVIKKEGKLYSITPIGRELLEDESKYQSIVKEQLLKSYCINKKEDTILFPYRAILKILLEFNYITRFEFLYCIYSLRGTTKEYIQESIERIYYLRNTYPNIDILSEENKIKVLDLINSKYDVQFGFKDIWTSRTTTYNQFNYFKKHLWIFSNIFDTDDRSKNDREKIRLLPGTQASISELLNLTSQVESICNLTQLEETYSSRFTRL
ncbi:DEAD/DEAH box helicase [Clostridium sporogenes]|nr:DEAD/DEAH box helicase [Clostridium sporogenes]NFS24932.1 DEAD/DEAH box helicase [Clostridium sporogenes]